MEIKKTKSKNIRSHLNVWVCDALAASGLSQTALANRLFLKRAITSDDRSIVNKMTKDRAVKAHEVFAIAEITGYPAPNKSDDEAISIPLVSEVAAGNLTELSSVESLDDWPKINAADLPYGVWVAMQVKGSSMDRVSPDGSTIFVNLADKTMVPGRCYVFQDENGAGSYKRYYDDPLRFEPWSTGDFPSFFPDQMPKIIGSVHRTMYELITPKVRR